MTSIVAPGSGPQGASVTDQAGTRDELPRHVAIIMDGNRRWARERGLPEAQGHAAGVEAIRPIVERSVELGVEVLSIYAFSRENWQRASHEVRTLFALLESAIRDETPRLREQGVAGPAAGPHRGARARHACVDRGCPRGDRGRDPDDPQRGLQLLRRARSSSDAVQRCIADGLAPDDVTEAALDARLYTAGLPEPDLLIRTGGDQRVSNFLLWQAAYAELYFCDRYWPDFDRTAYDAALAEYARRSRRFGR